MVYIHPNSDTDAQLYSYHHYGFWLLLHHNFFMLELWQPCVFIISKAIIFIVKEHTIKCSGQGINNRHATFPKLYHQWAFRVLRVFIVLYLFPLVQPSKFMFQHTFWKPSKCAAENTLPDCFACVNAFLTEALLCMS